MDRSPQRMARGLILGALISATVGLQGLPAAADDVTSPLVITTDTTLTQDHVGEIVIGADGVTLDCAGFTISSETQWWGTGVDVENRAGVTVSDCTISGFLYGVDVSGSTDTLIIGNTVRDNARGIGELETRRTQVVANRITENGRGVFSYGSREMLVSRNRVTGNRENGLLLVYLAEAVVSRNHVMDNGDTGIWIDRGGSNEVVDNIVMRNGENGIVLYGVSNTTVTSNVACRNAIFDAIESPGDEPGINNVWVDNRFCTPLMVYPPF